MNNTTMTKQDKHTRKRNELVRWGHWARWGQMLQKSKNLLFRIYFIIHNVESFKDSQLFFICIILNCKHDCFIYYTFLSLVQFLLKQCGPICTIFSNGFHYLKACLEIRLQFSTGYQQVLVYCQVLLTIKHLLFNPRYILM